MGGAVPLTHLVETVVGAQVEAVVRQQQHGGVLPKARGAQRVHEAPDLEIDMAASGEIAAHHLTPGLVAGLFRGPLAVGNIGGLIDRHAGLRAELIFGMGAGWPADRGCVIHLIKAVGADQIVMRVFEAKLNQVATRGVGTGQIVDRVLRHRVIVKGVITTAVILGVVDPGDPRPLVKVVMRPAPTPLFHRLGILVKQDTAVVARHRLVVGVGLAGGKGAKPGPAQIEGPACRGRQHIAPEAVEIDQPGAERRQAGGKLGPARGAQRHRGIGVGKAGAVGHQPVDVGGLDRDAKRLAPGEDINHVVDPDDADIARAGGIRIKAHAAPFPAKGQLRRLEPHLEPVPEDSAPARSARRSAQRHRACCATRHARHGRR